MPSLQTLPLEVLHIIISHVVEIPADHDTSPEVDTKVLQKLFPDGLLRSCKCLRQAALDFVRMNCLFMHVDLHKWSNAYRTDLVSTDLPVMSPQLIHALNPNSAQVATFVMRDQLVKATPEQRAKPTLSHGRSIGQPGKRPKSYFFPYSFHALMKLYRCVTQTDSLARWSVFSDTSVRCVSKVYLDMDRTTHDWSVRTPEVLDDLMSLMRLLSVRFDAQLSKNIADTKQKEQVYLAKGWDSPLVQEVVDLYGLVAEFDGRQGATSKSRRHMSAKGDMLVTYGFPDKLVCAGSEYTGCTAMDRDLMEQEFASLWARMGCSRYGFWLLEELNFRARMEGRGHDSLAGMSGTEADGSGTDLDADSFDLEEMTGSVQRGRIDTEDEDKVAEGS